MDSPNSKAIDIISTYFIEIIQIVILLGFILLKFAQVIDQQTLLVVSLFVIGSISVRFLATTYLNYVITIRNTAYFQDNRTANFLTFDALKFVLILVSLISIIVLGLNNVLNNETIATLLGGLIGSLLTMRGSYSDLKPLSKKEMEELNPTSQTPQP
ncbi:hypothetical protein A2690_00495 [Candidatus Roizmanbacteria bacterium RIFCSPHIGHO2_01_FULL_39_12b]|uniref:Uncharacterized protein n=1 Tax=Candidatus Roizmanbacteria bacterium RIFCSPHIGHO2_01_FULL_39_12b TaxID=1802030 RepID=A0A1F7G8R9_9BACT|nr:MAG: hypothetical protein A2690_00495 [Candidatus Roizmanbacteria bacterium RIFCSPHIGHO2_01_FULL_39_12b]OGK46039.1 MAG: hypothetical protein A3B46_00785 [Candidatus Roizmanbacteria bacterium RIFCSPLOWO2_01_FULL_39_19]